MHIFHYSHPIRKMERNYKRDIFLSWMICIFILFFVGSCTKVYEGEIVDKTYEPAVTTEIFYPMYIFDGNGGMIVYYIPMLSYDDEDFIVTIQGYDNDSNVTTSKFYLTQKQWDSLKVGDYVCFTDECMDDPEERTEIDE